MGEGTDDDGDAHAHQSTGGYRTRGEDGEDGIDEDAKQEESGDHKGGHPGPRPEGNADVAFGKGSRRGGTHGTADEGTRGIGKDGFAVADHLAIFPDQPHFVADGDQGGRGIEEVDNFGGNNNNNAGGGNYNRDASYKNLFGVEPPGKNIVNNSVDNALRNNNKKK